MPEKTNVFAPWEKLPELMNVAISGVKVVLASWISRRFPIVETNALRIALGTLFPISTS